MNAINTKAKVKAIEASQNEVESEVIYDEGNGQATKEQPKAIRERKSIFDKWSEKLKDFLDNAE
jgi:cell division protein FtsA